MPYRYLEDIATADAAFEAWGNTVEELFIAAADATVNVMVSDLKTIRALDTRPLDVTEETLDLLLFQLLQEIIFYKDAEQLLLRATDLEIQSGEGLFSAKGLLSGEPLDPVRHELVVDIKAVTLHRLTVQETADGWRACVVLDI